MMKTIKICLQIVGIFLFCGVCLLWESRLAACNNRKGTCHQAGNLEGRSGSSVLRVLTYLIGEHLDLKKKNYIYCMNWVTDCLLLNYYTNHCTYINL